MRWAHSERKRHPITYFKYIIHKFNTGTVEILLPTKLASFNFNFLDAQATNMIEEVHSVAENKDRLLEEERLRKLEEAEEKKKEEERKKARESGKRRAPLVKRTSQMPSGDRKTSRDSSVGRKPSQEDSRARSRSLSKGRENTSDRLSKSPARPGMAKRASSKSPART